MRLQGIALVHFLVLCIVNLSHAWWFDAFDSKNHTTLTTTSRSTVTTHTTPTITSKSTITTHTTPTTTSKSTITTHTTPTTTSKSTITTHTTPTTTSRSTITTYTTLTTTSESTITTQTTPSTTSLPFKCPTQLHHCRCYPLIRFISCDTPNQNTNFNFTTRTHLASLTVKNLTNLPESHNLELDHLTLTNVSKVDPSWFELPRKSLKVISVDSVKLVNNITQRLDLLLLKNVKYVEIAGEKIFKVQELWLENVELLGKAEALVIGAQKVVITKTNLPMVNYTPPEICSKKPITLNLEKNAKYSNKFGFDFSSLATKNCSYRLDLSDNPLEPDFLIKQLNNLKKFQKQSIKIKLDGVDFECNCELYQFYWNQDLVQLNEVYCKTHRNWLHMIPENEICSNEH